MYIENQELQQKEIITSLIKLIEYSKKNNLNYDIKILLLPFFKSKINGTNLLEIEKNKNLYCHIFYFLEIISNNEDNNFLITIGNYLNNLYEELDLLIKNSKKSADDMFILHLYCVAEIYYNKYNDQKNILDISDNISDDIKIEYCNIMKKIQFGTYELLPTHRFYSYKNNKPIQSSLVRILSEISSFKSSLPLNWESTIWIRIPQDNYNIFSFLISGPKDTPYENGLFEFHAYFPENYPNTVPQVLLHTTGGNTIRFNPNLYDTGKVCLSLLNTWSGRDEEKWNNKTSTFLQVMISIQSLILVDEPYFNEPGWEIEMNTPKGKENSDAYNEDRQPYTIKLAMIDMINNPPNGFEDVVKNHFKFKKDEIINTTTKWGENAKYKSSDINTYLDELKILFNNL
jgi:ubiquitin-protein ligase